MFISSVFRKRADRQKHTNTHATLTHANMSNEILGKLEIAKKKKKSVKFPFTKVIENAIFAQNAAIC